MKIISTSKQAIAEYTYVVEFDERGLIKVIDALQSHRTNYGSKNSRQWVEDVEEMITALRILRDT